MCENCPAAVLTLAKRLSAYIEAQGNHIVGGLHIVLEDENVSDEHLTWALDPANWPKAEEFPTLPTDAESAAIGQELLKLTVPERHQVVRMAWESPHMQPWSEEY